MVQFRLALYAVGATPLWLPARWAAREPAPTGTHDQDQTAPLPRSLRGCGPEVLELECFLNFLYEADDSNQYKQLDAA